MTMIKPLLEIIPDCLNATVSYYARNNVFLEDISEFAVMANGLNSLLNNNLIPNGNTSIPINTTQIAYTMSISLDFLVFRFPGYLIAVSIIVKESEYEIITVKSNKDSTDCIIYIVDRDGAIGRVSHFVFETMSNGIKFNTRGAHLVPFTYSRNKDLKNWVFPELSYVTDGKIINAKVSEL